jgi:MFS family permease
MHAAAPNLPSARGRAFALLRRGPFARYISGEAVSMMGTWMQQMAQGWVMATLTTSAFALGLVTFASTLPILLLTMYGGLLADRLDKRFIIIACLVAQSLLAVAIGWLVGSGQIAIWHVLVAGIVLGIVTAFEMPAASALVPELVAKEDISSAIAVDRSVFHATRLAGPALGGWLIGTFGTSAAFYVNATSFSALIIALLTIKLRALDPEAEEERRTGLKEGLAFVRQDRPTMVMIGLMALSTLFISPFFMIMMPLYSMHVLHLGAAQHGILLGSSGVGAVIGSIALLSIPGPHRQACLCAAVVVVSIATAGLSFAAGLPLAIVSIITLTLGTSTIFGLSNTIVQERAPDGLRGRVSAIASLAFFGVLPFASLATTKLADIDRHAHRAPGGVYLLRHPRAIATHPPRETGKPAAVRVSSCRCAVVAASLCVYLALRSVQLTTEPYSIVSSQFSRCALPACPVQSESHGSEADREESIRRAKYLRPDVKEPSNHRRQGPQS